MLRTYVLGRRAGGQAGRQASRLQFTIEYILEVGLAHALTTRHYSGFQQSCNAGASLTNEITCLLSHDLVYSRDS